MNKITLVFISLLSISFSINSYALDATKDGDWISMGVPSYFHVGTQGLFYVNGPAGSTQHGSCAGVKPHYFRMDMGAPHFYAMYSWMLHMSKENKPVGCVVKSGCGTNQVWVEYCRGEL
ncbi:hypothetical protein [Vibrio aestuarianus]|uniref:hypothetical protein n=1 Tax=Vibrio aestuarianus TaxID=28171 RepID=UPI00237C5B6B|nr:hypothetical protein [Vibrio aestuarianus]MDE1327268.1 hypothetical protein [Vibrio aestuarianus]